jgi:AraC-like DNA-binding protein
VVTLDEGGWIGADAAVRRPPTPLADLVEHVFVLDVRGARQRSWMILPDYAAHVIVRIEHGPGGRRVAPCSVVGPRSAPITVDVSGRAWTVGVRLRPGALPAILRSPAIALLDRTCGAGEAWGAAGDRLDERLSSGRDAEALLTHLVAFLGVLAERGAERAWPVRALSRQILESGGTVPVHRVAERMGVSSRGLREHSRELVGISPKRFARTHRLFRAVELARASGSPDWARVASAAGYADQPHLVREFRALLGETPVRYHARGRRADSFNTGEADGATLP